MLDSSNSPARAERKMDFAVPQMWYGKVPVGLTPTSTCKREEEEEKEVLCGLPELDCLATYIGYAPCASICLC